MRSITIALCFLASASSFAQGKAEPAPKAQNVTFDDDLVKGELMRPAGTIYSVPPRAKFGSLIQVRMSFNDKLAESVHEM
jgi:hypothetical protein